MNQDSTAEFWRHSDLPFVETRRASQSRVCYKSHSHPTFSIGAVDQGFSQFNSHFAQNRQIKAGSLVVVPAHIEHSCNPLPNHAWSYQMMHLDAHWITTLFDEFVNEQYRDFKQKHVPKLSPFVMDDPMIYQVFCNLNSDLFSENLSIYEKEQQLIETLTQILLPNFDFKVLRLPKYSQDHFSKVLEFIHLSQQFLSLEQLAEFAHMSRYAIIRLFKNNLGMTPHAYQLNLKINQARELLKQGQDIVFVAHDLGFVDQSHFHRTFKQFTGVTPKQYREH